MPKVTYVKANDTNRYLAEWLEARRDAVEEALVGGEILVEALE